MKESGIQNVVLVPRARLGSLLRKLTLFCFLCTKNDEAQIFFAYMSQLKTLWLPSSSQGVCNWTNKLRWYYILRTAKWHQTKFWSTFKNRGNEKLWKTPENIFGVTLHSLLSEAIGESRAITPESNRWCPSSSSLYNQLGNKMKTLQASQMQEIDWCAASSFKEINNFIHF